MMHGREKSDRRVVPRRPANNAERSATEGAEGRRLLKGSANRHSTRRTQCRTSCVTSAALAAWRNWTGHPDPKAAMFTPKRGARCGKAARRDLCGGRQVIAVPTATAPENGALPNAREAAPPQAEDGPSARRARVGAGSSNGAMPPVAAPRSGRASAAPCAGAEMVPQAIENIDSAPGNSGSPAADEPSPQADALASGAGTGEPDRTPGSEGIRPRPAGVASRRGGIRRDQSHADERARPVARLRPTQGLGLRPSPASPRPVAPARA